MPGEQTGRVEADLSGDPRQQMLALNRRQAEFYQSRLEAKAAGPHASERAANLATNAWTWLRRRIMGLRREAGVDDRLLSLHRGWLGDVTNARVLDLGCFDGNRLSLWLAENAAEYVGIDLSADAVARLERTLRERELPNAHAYAMDFLANDWPDGRFDIVYAYSVLHHFGDLGVALEELRRILVPHGAVVAMDPMMTEPLNRVARVLYRPFQTDRAWEFPFDRATFEMVQRYFEIEQLQGLGGVVRLAYPFLMIPGLQRVGRALASRTLAIDNKHARTLGLAFYQCWHVTMKLRRPLT